MIVIIPWDLRDKMFSYLFSYLTSVIVSCQNETCLNMLCHFKLKIDMQAAEKGYIYAAENIYICS